MNFHQIFHASFLCAFLAQVSDTSFFSDFCRYNAGALTNLLHYITLLMHHCPAADAAVYAAVPE